MAGTLYLVGTPIGNLNDLSPRAIETLKSVDFIAAEDTRVTLKLLNHFGIRRPLISYYEHNKVESAAVILPRLLGGESCALVSDAGMPAISDPGEELVRLCGEHGITVSAAPGPSAVITALVGFPSPNYCVHTIMHHLDDYGGQRFEMGYASAIATILFFMMIGSNLLVTKILRKVGS